MTKAAEENASLRQKMIETMQRSAAAAAVGSHQTPQLPQNAPLIASVEISAAKSVEPSGDVPKLATPKRGAVPVAGKKAPPQLGSPERVKRPSIRLTDEDLSRVREVMGHALSLRENISTTDVLRLALHEWDYRKLTPEKIGELRAQDGRRKSAS